MERHAAEQESDWQAAFAVLAEVARDRMKPGRRYYVQSLLEDLGIDHEEFRRLMFVKS